jgi:mono/diheme cytochrome c family protein
MFSYDPPPPMRRRRTATILSLLAVSLTVAACGSRGIQGREDNTPGSAASGAQLFAERCSGCHTLDVVGAEGSAVKVHDRERVDGPNFNTRKETKDQVLYAIRNGGFSGAIMPENIVVGDEADRVAEFLAKYSGRQGATAQGAK